MTIEGGPDPEFMVVPRDWVSAEEGPVVPRDWVMLDRIGRTYCYDDLGAAGEAVKGNKTAVQVKMESGQSFFVSFALGPPPEEASYLDVHWPQEGKVNSSPRQICTYPFVRAIDKDLVLFHVDIPSQYSDYLTPSDLFVYTAAGSSPSVQHLPLYHRSSKPFLMDNFSTGILRRRDDRYVVSDVILCREKNVKGNYSVHAELCVFNSKTRNWSFFRRNAPQPQDQSNGNFPTRWSTDTVLAFEDRFLCWVDYLSGLLLSDFSNMRCPVLHFVPFPGEEEYPRAVRANRCFAQRYRSVSISQGKMYFVHIDNALHTGWLAGQQPCQNITIWTLNVMDGNSRFKWEPHRVIDLNPLWVHPSIPEYPIISASDPDVLCCLLRKKDFCGAASMFIVDIKHACLGSPTPYINRRSEDEKNHKNEFPNTPLLPTVFSEYIERQTGMPWDTDKLVTHLSKKLKFSV